MKNYKTVHSEILQKYFHETYALGPQIFGLRTWILEILQREKAKYRT